MIQVIVFITAEHGKRDEILKHFNANAPTCRDEVGCIEYAAAVDAPDAPSRQAPLGPDRFVITEKWESMEALEAHAASSHMAAYGAEVKNMVAERTIHILTMV